MITDDIERCSFCRKTKDEVHKLFAGKAAMICSDCVFAADADLPRVAYCADCTAANGTHDAQCVQRERA